MEPVICVFAKPPTPGLAKTRLAPAVGAEGAARLAAAFLEDTLDALGRLRWGRVAVATTGPFPGRLAPVLGDVPQWEQGDGDLGARVERVLRRALGEAPAAFALGADSPGFPLAPLETARSAVERGAAALGPTEDGGFWLLALPACPKGLFDDLPWSAAETFDVTRRRLESSGFEVAIVDRYFDVDRPEDLDRLAAAIRGGEVVAPATARLVEELMAGGDDVPR